MSASDPDPCVSCGYDLTALPDGVCPECGAAFTHEGNAAIRASKPRRFNQVAEFLGRCIVTALIGICVIAVSVGLAEPRDVIGTAAAIGLCPLIGMIVAEVLMFEQTRRITKRRACGDLAVATAVLVACWFTSWSAAGIGAAVFAAAVSQLFTAFSIRKSALLLVPAACLIAFGVFVFASAQARINTGFLFSEWDNANLQFESTFAMSNRRARAISLDILKVGALVAAGGCIVFICTRPRPVPRENPADDANVN